MGKDVSTKAMPSKVMKLDSKNVEMKGMVLSLEVLSQELRRKIGYNKKSRGNSLDRMMRQFPTRYVGIGLAVYLRIRK